MFIYQSAVLCALCLMALVLSVNLIGFPSVRRAGRTGVRHSVSVLLPARNEERQIAACLSSLAAQDYPQFEVLVLDDGSTDRTAALVRTWSESGSCIRLLTGAPLPEGWAGKSHACHQLSRHAQGDLLLFIDADTVLEPHALSAAVAELDARGADLVSLIPHQLMGSFWEKVVLPLLHFGVMCFLPFPLVTSTGNPKLAMANGQFMLFRRAVYEKIGGHEAVRAALVEDVWLARLVKRNGFRLLVMDGGSVVSCRMYRCFAEIWEGFSKNLFAGFSYSVPALAAVVLFMLAVSVGPFLFPLFIPLRGEPPAWAGIVLVQFGVLLVMRLALAMRFRMSPLFSLSHPLAVLVVAGIAANSVRQVRAGGGALWKGRRYNLS